MVNKINLTDMQAAIDKRSQSELRQASTNNEQREESQSLTEKAWPKLQAMYGYKFTSQFGELPDSTWVSCLKGITARQIADGLNNCLEMHPEWPPGAAQFRAACLGKHLDDEGNDSSWQHKSAAYKDINDPKHPRNDPASPEYVATAPKGIEGDQWKRDRKKAGRTALRGMMEDLK